MFSRFCNLFRPPKREDIEAGASSDNGGWDGRCNLQGALDIEYVDATGTRTERYIEAISLEVKDDKLYLWGWCESRQAIRKFLVHRVAALSDGETGEVIAPEHIANWLRERAQARTVSGAA